MKKEFSYEGPKYGHSAASLESIRALQSLPLWARRRHYRSWTTQIPSFIYRYLDFRIEDSLSMKKVTDLLVLSQLYLPAPSDFNDPYDFRAVISLTDDPVERRKYFKKSARRLLKSHPEWARHLKGKDRKIEWLTQRAMQNSIDYPNAQTEAFERHRDLNGVACFCLDPRNLLMWSLYASGHTGICIIFDVMQDPGVLAIVHPVTYHEDMAHLVWPKDKDRIVEDVILRKGAIWRHEQEVRYVSLTTVRESIEFNGEAVTGVILGSRFPMTSLDRLRELLRDRERNGLPTPRIFRAIQKADSYGVAIQRIKNLGDLT